MINKLSIVPPPEKQKLPFDDLGKVKPEDTGETDQKKKKEENKEELGIAAMHFRSMKAGLQTLEKMMGTLENDTAQVTHQIETVEAEK